jgi:PTH1 family peptidyl-tRNA hydrolase
VILVVGLGNPGTRYLGTRHNVGAMVVDEVHRRAQLPAWRAAYRGKFALCAYRGRRMGLLKPDTFMNASGHSVRVAAAFYKLDPEQLLVVHDEMDLPFGELRLKQGGGDAGHNGLRSITEQLGAQDYGRLRFGIGRPPEDFAGDGADFVLQAFAPAERADLESRVGAAADAIDLVLSRGLAAAMNVINQRRPR